MPAPQFHANTASNDPYKNYRFKVKWDGSYLAGVSKVSMLKRSTEAVQHRTDGDPSIVRVAPGPSTYDPITLERGVTHDVTFQQSATRSGPITTRSAPIRTSRSRISARTSPSSCSTNPDRRYSAIMCTAAGFRNSRPCRNSTAWATPSPFKCSNSRMKALGARRQRHGADGNKLHASVIVTPRAMQAARRMGRAQRNPSRLRITISPRRWVSLRSTHPTNRIHSSCTSCTATTPRRQ